MYQLEKTSKGITARVVQASESVHGKKIITFELEYPRFVHSELLTHRMFSRNAMSSRAVPVKKMIDQVMKDPAMPVHWGKNQSGMQADEECDNDVWNWNNDVRMSRDEAWRNCAIELAMHANTFSESGYHKQIVNRLIEPFQKMKTVVTATEWYNFFELRCHKDAQPEIKLLAELMRECYEEAEFMPLNSGEWHVPYVNRQRCSDTGNLYYYLDEDTDVSDINALKVSASCCAQVSYRALDDSLDKALDIYDRLVTSKPIHASPFEHQAMAPSSINFAFKTDLDKGFTHYDLSGNAWSGNFKGWIQYRQLL